MFVASLIVLDPSQPCNADSSTKRSCTGGWVVLVRGGGVQNGKSCPRGNLHTKPPNKVISGESRGTNETMVRLSGPRARLGADAQ